jgi:hypothetical protein
MARTNTRVIIVMALTLMLVSAATAAQAGSKGGGKPGGTTGGGSLTLVMWDPTDTVVNFGDKVTFAVSTSSTAYPWVTMKCSQGGTLVYKQSNGIFATSLGTVFTLGPTPLWLSGEADCTASLENWDSYAKRGSITTLASIPVHVYA